MTVRTDSFGPRDGSAVRPWSTLGASAFSTTTLSLLATVPAAAFTETTLAGCPSGSPVPDRPLRHLAWIRRLLQTAPLATETLEVPRAASQMTSKIDDAQV